MDEEDTLIEEDEIPPGQPQPAEEQEGFCEPADAAAHAKAAPKAAPEPAKDQNLLETGPQLNPEEAKPTAESTQAQNVKPPQNPEGAEPTAQSTQGQDLQPPQNPEGAKATPQSTQGQNLEPPQNPVEGATQKPGTVSATDKATDPRGHVGTGQGAVYTALASGVIADIVYNRASSFDIKDNVLSAKKDESEDDRLFRIAHLLYMRMNRSLKSYSGQAFNHCSW